VTSSHRNEDLGLTHAYYTQIINGLEVANGVGNANVNSEGKIISVANAFHRNPAPPTPSQTKTASEAVTAFAQKLEITDIGNLVTEQSPDDPNAFTVTGASFVKGSIPARLKYFQVDNGQNLRRVWDLQVKTDQSR